MAVKIVRDPSHHTNDETYICLLTILPDPDSVRVHAHPFGFGFQSIIDDLELYKGFRYTWESLPEAIGTGHLHGISGEGFAEVLILGTCVFEYVTDSPYPYHAHN